MLSDGAQTPVAADDRACLPIVVAKSPGSGLASPADDPSNSDMERRPFFRMLGIATSAVLAETLGVEQWELARAMQASNVSDDMLDAMEASVLRLHQVHAKLSPAAMLPHLHEHLRAATSLLQHSQPIRQRRRLCSIAGHLAGLRGWATFDLGDREGARSWYELALQPASEAEDDALAGWVFGAWSLVPTYDGESAEALTLIRRGQNHARRSLDVTARAWLGALEARAHAGLGDARAFRHAQDEANDGIDRTHSEQRRHGMDFDGDHLDVAYYEGTSLVTSASRSMRSPSSATRWRSRARGTSRHTPSCTSRWRRPTCINTRSSGRAKSGSRLLTSERPAYRPDRPARPGPAA